MGALPIYYFVSWCVSIIHSDLQSRHGRYMQAHMLMNKKQMQNPVL